MKKFVSLLELKKSPRSYIEDFHLENGNYVCTCYKCKESFIGYKRRVVCKLCNVEKEGEKK